MRGVSLCEHRKGENKRVKKKKKREAPLERCPRSRSFHAVRFFFLLKRTVLRGCGSVCAQPPDVADSQPADAQALGRCILARGSPPRERRRGSPVR